MAKSVANTRQRLSKPFEYARKESKRRNFLIVLIVFIIVTVCVLVLTSALYQVVLNQINTRVMPITTDLDRLNICDALQIVTIILICLYVTHFEKRRLHSMGFIARHAFWKYLWGLILGAISIAAAAGISYLALGGTFTINTDMFAYWPVFAVTGVCFIIQGLAEEVIFRGYLVTSLGRKYPIAFAAILSGIAFAAAHFMDPGISVMAYVNLFLVGVFLSLMFYHTESIWAVAAWHSMWNFAQGSLLGLRVSGLDLSPSLATLTLGTGRGPINLTSIWSEEFLNELWSGGTFGPEASIGTTLIMIIFIILECVLIHKKFRTPIEEQEGTIVDNTPIPIPEPAPVPPATTPQTLDDAPEEPASQPVPEPAPSAPADGATPQSDT